MAEKSLALFFDLNTTYQTLTIDSEAWQSIDKEGSCTQPCGREVGKPREPIFPVSCLRERRDGC